MKKRRYLAHRAFPPYIFIPGQNPHPKKSGGHMEGEEDPLCSPLDQAFPQDSETLRYSLDLFNHAYYWEAHVYLEALWNAHQREGGVADFLKALIKLSAAGVKLNLDQKESAAGHLKRARDLLEEVMGSEGELFLGFNLQNILSEIHKSLGEELSLFEIHPSWPHGT